MSEEAPKPNQDATPPPVESDFTQLLDEAIAQESQAASKPIAAGEPEPSSAGARIQQALTARRLKHVKEKLAATENSGDQSPQTIAANEERMAKLGRAAVVNMGIAGTYGKGLSEDGKIDPSSITNRRSRRVYERNTRKIAKIISRTEGSDEYKRRLQDKRAALEEKLGIAPEPPKEEKPAVYTPAQRPMDNSTARELREKKVTLPSQEAYVSLLEQAIENGTLDESDSHSALGQMLSSNPTLAKFTISRLRKDGVIDETGKIIMSPDKIKQVLTFSGRVTTESEDAERVKKETAWTEKARDLFEKAEQWVDKLVAEDKSRYPLSEKYDDARTHAWNDTAYIVDMNERFALMQEFRKLLAERESKAPVDMTKTKPAGIGIGTGASRRRATPSGKAQEINLSDEQIDLLEKIDKEVEYTIANRIREEVQGRDIDVLPDDEFKHISREIRENTYRRHFGQDIDDDFISRTFAAIRQLKTIKAEREKAAAEAAAAATDIEGEDNIIDAEVIED